MAENKWIMDGHHYTCPNCKKTIAVVVNESDEGLEFCPFCGKRMSSQMAEDRLEVTHLMGKKLDKPIIIERGTKTENKMEQVDFWIRYFKEHTNTIGCVELDGLDCREVLALLQELADKKADKPNKMEAVAQLFGKKLNEEFEIVTPRGKVRKVKFTTDRGLLYYDRIENEWNKNFGFLNFLCEGKAVIVDA